METTILHPAFELTTVPTQVAHRLAPLKDVPAGSLLIHEIYRSLQGESTFAGLPCVFIRLAVCDSRCSWCDTKQAFNQGTVFSGDDVFAKAMEYESPLVEITGGEPLLQPAVHPLISELADAGKKVLIETSGAHSIDRLDPRATIVLDLKCPDSGECERNHWPNLEILKPNDEIKFVIASKADWSWAEETIRKHRLDSRFEVLVSAVFGTIPLSDLAERILTSKLNIRMQLQMHKYIWDPKARGV